MSKKEYEGATIGNMDGFLVDEEATKEASLEAQFNEIGRAPENEV